SGRVDLQQHLMAGRDRVRPFGDHELPPVVQYQHSHGTPSVAHRPRSALIFRLSSWAAVQLVHIHEFCVAYLNNPIWNYTLRDISVNTAKKGRTFSTRGVPGVLWGLVIGRPFKPAEARRQTMMMPADQAQQT